jgi:hypothetical protein
MTALVPEPGAIRPVPFRVLAPAHDVMIARDFQ